MNSRHLQTAKSKTSRNRRRGAVLVWFAVFLFVLLPLMMLIVHLGMVTLTRRQMQTAVNSAAIEGLRFRDDGLSESDRRVKVRNLVSAIFDDNLNSDGVDALNVGAGPTIDFDDDPTDIPLPGTKFVASRTIKSGNIGVHKPSLQVNEDNEVFGDMLSGNYHESADHQEGVDPYITLEEQYQRDDFTIDSDTTDDVRGDAFLVRMRRSNESFSDGIGTAGPTIPFLFGRGPYGGADLLNRRERGTIVRATAIAQAHPAKSIGRMLPEVNNTDFSNIVLYASFWSDPEENSPWTPVGENEESATSDPVELDDTVGELLYGGQSIGRLIDISSVQFPLTIGELDSDFDTASSGIEPTPGIVTIVSEVNRDSSGTDLRVVGFGLIDNVEPQMNTYTFTRLNRFLLPRNATSYFAETEHLQDIPANDIDVNDLMMKHMNVTLRPGLLLAPALVRSLD